MGDGGGGQMWGQNSMRGLGGGGGGGGNAPNINQFPFMDGGPDGMGGGMPRDSLNNGLLDHLDNMEELLNGECESLSCINISPPPVMHHSACMTAMRSNSTCIGFLHVLPGQPSFKLCLPQHRGMGCGSAGQRPRGQAAGRRYRGGREGGSTQRAGAGEELADLPFDGQSF